MSVYRIDPLQDSRWEKLLDSHPNASVFHTRGWLETLSWTYGYEPIAYTTSPPNADLSNAVLFCMINSWLTGRRSVSLPFSDHCEPLVNLQEDLAQILQKVCQDCEEEAWSYVELRPLSAHYEVSKVLQVSKVYWVHVLDLRPTQEELFQSFHSCTRRKIRRAERENILCQEGTSDTLLSAFYELLLKTRRRHCIPPQPYSFFRNLVRRMGDNIAIRLASKDSTPIAAIITLRFKKRLVYKYGCSDARYHKLGGVQILFWTAIKEAKQADLQEFDLGRSDTDNHGLITFKNRWGSQPVRLIYYAYPSARGHFTSPAWRIHADRVLAHLPDRILSTAGRLLYRHVG